MRKAIFIIAGAALVFVIFILLLALAILGASRWGNIYRGNGRDE